MHLTVCVLNIANNKIIMKTFANNNIQCHGTSQIKFEVAMIILHMHALFMNNVVNTVEYRPQTVVVSQGLVGTSPRTQALHCVADGGSLYHLHSREPGYKARGRD